MILVNIQAKFHQDRIIYISNVLPGGHMDARAAQSIVVRLKPDAAFAMDGSLHSCSQDSRYAAEPATGRCQKTVLFLPSVVRS